ncbi:MAG: GNAT family N-acetyltransferase [Candidatus Sericytochromatia bacterium]
MSLSSFFKKDPLSFLDNEKNIKLIESIKQVKKEDWNELIGRDNPFLEYEFFKALEVSKSIGENSGWLPKYLTYFEDNKLLGVIPMYLKFNSYGEYIFDWNWASAYNQAGLVYYPKLVIAIPFTPATTKKILIHPNYNFAEISDKLIDILKKIAKALNVSSIHWLFTTKDEFEYLYEKGFAKRYTHQFHWKNNSYNSFEDFLKEFNSKKRNQIRRERKQANSNLQIEILEGEDIKAEHWKVMYELYISTSDRKWGSPYLKKTFFEYIGQNFKEYPVMMIARDDKSEIIAAALNFRKNNHLYGRYWGCFKDYQCLHFELCYYQAIDYCIKNNIDLFEAGAQGEHKLARGFLPEYTYSNHLILDERFSFLIKDYLVKEKKQLDEIMKYYKDNAPF